MDCVMCNSTEEGLYKRKKKGRTNNSGGMRINGVEI
jgi:hypothetical protein